MTAIKSRVTSPCGKPRLGKGFSRGELKEASSDRAEALRLKLPFDEKRKSVHTENVEALKAFLSAKRLAKKPKPDKKKAKS